GAASGPAHQGHDRAPGADRGDARAARRAAARFARSRPARPPGRPPGAARRCSRRRRLSNPRPLLILLGLLLLWQGLVWLTGVPPYLLPPPTLVARRLISAAPLLLDHAQVTLLE